jgi:type 1 fimbria pilin
VLLESWSVQDVRQHEESGDTFNTNRVFRPKNFEIPATNCKESSKCVIRMNVQFISHLFHTNTQNPVLTSRSVQSVRSVSPNCGAV